MLIDAQQLTLDGECLASNAFHMPADPDVAARQWDGTFAGLISVNMQSGGVFSVDGSRIASITVGPGVVEIRLQFPSPVPLYNSCRTLEIILRTEAGASRVHFGAGWERWIAHNVAKYSAAPGEWMQAPDHLLPQLRNRKFPLGDTGLGIATGDEGWYVDLDIAVGIFPDKDGRSNLVLMPTGGYANGGYVRAKGLMLDQLTTCPLGGDNHVGAWISAPCILSHPLNSSGTWQCIAYWSPFDGEKPGKKDRLEATEVFRLAWNDVARAMRAAQRTNLSAQPWLPIPSLEWLDLDSALTPWLRFDIGQPGRSAARLSQILLRPAATRRYAARLDWQYDAILAGAPTAPGGLAHLSLLLDLRLDKAPPAWSTWSVDMPAILDAGLVEQSDPTLLADWTFAIDGIRTAAPGKKWISLGSMEFTLDGVAQPAADVAFLRSQLRGEWTFQRRDLYPEIALSFNCRVRVSALSDAAGRDLTASLDAANLAEENLHKDTEPLRVAIGNGDEGRLCTLVIRHVCAPGRNPVTSMEVKSLERKPLGGEALYFQARPFIVARTQAIDIDDQAGRLIAAWRSDDREGAQWRVPDTELSFSFPPQAVGEEMERGNRFWEHGGPTINPEQPLRYRFSPPTRLVVQPSAVQRRYNKNPNNLGEVLSGARVKSFITEAAYPLEVSFSVSDAGEPDVRIAETASFLGRPAANLPLPPSERPQDIDAASRWVYGVLSAEIAAWTDARIIPDLGLRACLLQASWQLRQAHHANRANFSARLGQFHLYDPWRKDCGLHLRDGLKFRIRDTATAPPLLNPLAQDGTAPNDLLPAQMQQIQSFLAPQGWAPPGQGSLRAGIIHTVEFASELVAILRSPQSASGTVERLAFTALGANANISAAFDEGRTEFVIESQHGQLARLTKIRIGRIGVMWNRAKHVIVYERTTVASLQFKDEQPAPATQSEGWPILRKTEEYVEPIDIVREFNTEAHKDINVTGFVDSFEFVSQRIYVNGGWGKDLGHGYELPLWNRQDRSGFYPKPQLALRTRAGGGAMSRCWLDEPEHVYFYSNAEAGAGNDPDRWAPKPAVDSPVGAVRLPVLSSLGMDANGCLDQAMMPAPSLAGARRPRYDFSVIADGKVNLQHARGETDMLATLNMIALARTDEVSATAPSALGGLANVANFSGKAGALEERISQLIAGLPQRILESGLNCEGLKVRLVGDVNALFSGLAADLGGLTGNTLDLASGWAAAARREISASLSGLQFGLVDGMEKTLQAAIHDAGDVTRTTLAMPQTATQAEIDAVKAILLGRINDFSTGVTKAMKLARELLDARLGQLDWAAGEIGQKLQAVRAAVAQAPDPITKDQLKAIAAQCDAVRGAVADAASAALVGPLAVRLASALAQVQSLAELLADRFAADITQLRSPALSIIDGAIAAVTAAEAARMQISTGIAALAQLVDAAKAQWQMDVSALAHSIEASPTLAALQEAAGQWLELAEHTGNGWIRTQLEPAIGEAATALETQATAMVHALLPVAADIRSVVAVASMSATEWAEQLRSAAIGAINSLGCGPLDELRAGLAAELKKAAQEVRRQVTGALSSMADDTTRQMLEDLTGGAEKIGKGLKLAKAIGELPALPTLTFNAARAEYVFDDLEKQITTSPFAAKLRDIDGGLKELGLAVPTQKLLDQIIPAGLADVDFSKVFKNLGGLDFQDFFKRFKLPDLSGDKIKITHGIDKDTRSAWAKAEVKADFAEEQTLFDCASMAVRLSNLQLRATSDTRVSADGQNRSVTEGRLVANWGLDFGGTRMAAFDEVTVKFDGNGFDFNIAPDKVRLHPSLKFIEDYARRFQDKLPPALQFDRDERGIPTGVRANFSTLIDKLPPIPPVTVGPLLLASGLGLRMLNNGVFEISTFVGLGAKQAPVFVQFSYLGGGFWIEGKCTATGADIVPSASLGLALGSMRALDVAGVARGSYSLLLFAYAEIDAGGGAVRAGLSLQGSARILGVANASLDLLLEVEHGNNGSSAHGWLHVEIEICWCYTLRVSKTATHNF